MNREELKRKVETIREKFSYRENFSKKSYFNSLKIWEKGGKLRVYVPRNAYEQAGYIACDEQSLGMDRTRRDLVQYKGFYLVPNRPGNLSSLKEFVDAILS